MPLLPTARAVADAITHYRQIQERTIDELSQRLAALDYDLPPAAICDLEDLRRPASVDDLVALAYALETTPAVLLSHIPIDMPADVEPLATALPADIEQPELRAWLESRTALDDGSRLHWAQQRVGRLRILAAHHLEQLEAALAELQELGELCPPGSRFRARTAPVRPHRHGRASSRSGRHRPGHRRAAARRTAAGRRVNAQLSLGWPL